MSSIVLIIMIIVYLIFLCCKACQWSWGQEPISPELDPAFPKGCLSGCPTRSQMKEMDITVKGGTICNA